MSQEEVIGPDKVSLRIEKGIAPEAQSLPASQKSLSELEKEALLNALRDSKGVQVEAAKKLGITLRQFRYRMQKYGIKKEFVLE